MEEMEGKSRAGSRSSTTDGPRRYYAHKFETGLSEWTIHPSSLLHPMTPAPAHISPPIRHIWLGEGLFRARLNFCPSLSAVALFATPTTFVWVALHHTHWPRGLFAFLCPLQKIVGEWVSDGNWLWRCKKKNDRGISIEWTRRKIDKKQSVIYLIGENVGAEHWKRYLNLLEENVKNLGNLLRFGHKIVANGKDWFKYSKKI